MLIEITEYQKIDERMLMDVYSESNYENTDYFYPDETDNHDFGLEYSYHGV